MAVPDEETGFLLKCTDEAVNIVQSLVTLLSLSYESGISLNGVTSNRMTGGLNAEALEDLYRLANGLLAKLWPCEKRYVAVIGPTGCGKSTLLNLLASMTCKAGEEYQQGLKLDESRAVLRDTVLEHGGGLEGVNHDDEIQLDGNEDSQEDPSSTSVVSHSENIVHLHNVNLEAEKEAMCGLLGICCARDKAAYFSKHLALYDRYPFLLQNGRMGDAGTTKVMALQWGPKFVARIQWVQKRKLRKRWRELRLFLDKPQPSEPADRDTPQDSSIVKLKENKELWQSMLKIVEHPLDSDQLPTPTEELIEGALKKLAKRVSLGKKEVIEANPSQGCVVDRLYVRDGIRRRLCEENLGLLLEDLVIEAPIPSSEGGVSLLDVPGTNDPRLLHQRETRDAIDRTTLILLILDKNVLDAGTEKVLEDSPLLERMLLDTSERCNLVVVGIAEKRCTGSKSASQIVAGFDRKRDLKRALKSIFLKKIRNLLKSRRLTSTEATARLRSISEDNRFHVLPVLPLLCASLHLSASNPVLHSEYCETPGESTCPLIMNEEERMKMCMQTNIPQLLEMIQSVRVPSSRVKLKSNLESTLSTLKMYLHESTYDESMLKFFDREIKHGLRMAKNPIAVETLVPDNSIDLNYIRDKLSSYSQQCILSPEDLKYLRLKVEGPDSLKVTNTSVNQDLPPVLMRGFRPEAIGGIARELLQPTEDKASSFVHAVYQQLIVQMNGNEAWRDNHLDQVSVECLGECVVLLRDVQTQWQHTMERTLARYTCGGSDGGLQKHIRAALRKAYDTTFKTAMVEMRKQRSKKASTDELLKFLEYFAFGEEVKNVAIAEIEKCVHIFWDTLMEAITKTVSKLWSDWISQLRLLKKSIKQALDVDIKNDSNTVSSERADHSLRTSLLKKISQLEQLVQRLEGETPLPGYTEVNYGYALLQNHPSYEKDLLNVASEHQSKTFIDSKPRIAIAESRHNSKPKIVIGVSCQNSKPRSIIEDSNQDEPPDIVGPVSSATPITSPKLEPEKDTAAPSSRTYIPTQDHVRAGTSLPSPNTPRTKLGGPKRLPSRGVITLPEHEAHNLHMANHEVRKDKRRRNW
ncbi:hypothetical protein Mapa_010320 [Marchantia paleacea]|nr:hypothetical protein Mapa_010320 [Marchantia paleacea]